MTEGKKLLPIYDDTAPTACTITDAEISERVELDEKRCCQFWGLVLIDGVASVATRPLHPRTASPQPFATTTRYG
jgi:hypothetical protein